MSIERSNVRLHFEEMKFVYLVEYYGHLNIIESSEKIWHILNFYFNRGKSGLQAHRKAVHG